MVLGALVIHPNKLPRCWKQSSLKMNPAHGLIGALPIQIKPLSIIDNLRDD